MTVEELIDQLKSYPFDCEVKLEGKPLAKEQLALVWGPGKDDLSVTIKTEKLWKSQRS